MAAKAWTAVPSSLASCVISEGRAESQEELPELPHRIWLILPLGDTLKKQTHPNSSAGVSTAKTGVASQPWGVLVGFPLAFPQFWIQDQGTGEEEAYPRLFFHFCLRTKPCLPLPCTAGPSRQLEITQEIVQKLLRVPSRPAAGTPSPAAGTKGCSCTPNSKALVCGGVFKIAGGSQQKEGVRCDRLGGGLGSTDVPAEPRLWLGEPPLPEERVTKGSQILLKQKINPPFLQEKSKRSISRCYPNPYISKPFPGLKISF